MSAVQKHGQCNAPGSSSDQPGIIDIEAMQVVMPLARAESWQPRPDLCPGVIDISDEDSPANVLDIVRVAEAARKSTKFGRCKILECGRALVARVSQRGKPFLGCSAFRSRGCEYVEFVTEARVLALFPRVMVTRVRLKI